MSAGSPADHESSRPDLRRVACNPNYWYPLARSRTLKRNKTLECRLCRRADRARPDRLQQGLRARGPLRAPAIPLSKGLVCGELIQCGYHAWRYDATGAITTIPHLVTGVRPPRHVRAYPCREAYGLVFVFPGDPALAEQTAFPELPWFDSPDYKVMSFERDIACHYTFMHENLMDMNHQFLHRRLMGRVKPRLLSHAKGDGWVEALYRFGDEGGKKHRGANWLTIGGSVDEANFEIMTIRTEYPYQTLKIAGIKTGSVPSLALWAAYVPTDRHERAQPELRHPPRSQAADGVPAHPDLARPAPFHGVGVRRGSDGRGGRAARVRDPGRRLEPGDLPRHHRFARLAAGAGIKPVDGDVRYTSAAP